MCLLQSPQCYGLTGQLQLPTALAFAAAIRQRGVQFSGIGFRSGNDVQGATGKLNAVICITQDLKRGPFLPQYGLCPEDSRPAEPGTATRA